MTRNKHKYKYCAEFKNIQEAKTPAKEWVKRNVILMNTNDSELRST